MLQTWPKERRLTPTDETGKKSVATLKRPLNDERGLGGECHDECHNHTHAEKSVFELQPAKVQPQCHVRDASRQPVNNSQLKSNPACPALIQPPGGRVSHNSPTNPHLRAVQWQARRKPLQRPESCSLTYGTMTPKFG